MIEQSGRDGFHTSSIVLEVCALCKRKVIVIARETWRSSTLSMRLLRHIFLAMTLECYNCFMESKNFESLYPADSREVEIARIVSFIKEGNSSQLIGLPGVGRANVLSLLAHNKEVRIKHFGENQKWQHFVLVNFSEVKNRTLFDVTKFFFLSLMESFRERGMQEEYEKVHEEFKEALSFQDELVLFQGLKSVIDYLCLEKELTIIFLFDRFAEYLPDLTTTFFANLRVLRNHAKYRFSVVFSLERPLEDIIEPALLSDFYEFIGGHYAFMRLYDPVSSAFRLAYLEKVTGRSLDASCMEDVHGLTGGHWRLTKICAEAMLAEEKHAGDLKAFLLSRKTVKEALVKIWGSFTPDEQAALATYAEGKKDSDVSMQEYLTEIGIIKESELQIPLLKEIIPSEQAASAEEKIVYDMQTNMIMKGDVEISDRLTAAEYRLLLFCLQNYERILEREEIISAVWKESATTAGVTDQALDQLIFRLRKKIEIDPNNPLHLQTVKGRGFKFTP